MTETLTNMNVVKSGTLAIGCYRYMVASSPGSPPSYFTTGSKVVRCTLAGESLGTRLGIWLVTFVGQSVCACVICELGIGQPT